MNEMLKIGDRIIITEPIKFSQDMTFYRGSFDDIIFTVDNVLISKSIKYILTSSNCEQEIFVFHNELKNKYKKIPEVRNSIECVVTKIDQETHAKCWKAFKNFCIKENEPLANHLIEMEKETRKKIWEEDNESI